MERRAHVNSGPNAADLRQEICRVQTVELAKCIFCVMHRRGSALAPFINRDEGAPFTVWERGRSHYEMPSPESVTCP